MTAPALNLSDLAGPDADGWSDVAVFVRPDGSESEPFVVTDDRNSGYVGIEYPDSRSAKGGGCPVRRLGRGQLVPARIVMEGEATARPLSDDDAFDVYSLADELYRANDDDRPGIVKTIREILDDKPFGVMTLDESVERFKRMRAATAPTPSIRCPRCHDTGSIPVGDGIASADTMDCPSCPIPHPADAREGDAAP